MAATDARELSYEALISGRVKYDLEYDSDNDLYRFKGKPPEVIKAAHNAAPDVFFDSSDDYSPIWFDSSALEYIYGDQVFFDVNKNKNLVVLNTAITGDCLTSMQDFINYVIWVIESGAWDDSVPHAWIDSETWIDNP